MSTVDQQSPVPEAIEPPVGSSPAWPPRDASAEEFGNDVLAELAEYKHPDETEEELSDWEATYYEKEFEPETKRSSTEQFEDKPKYDVRQENLADELFEAEEFARHAVFEAAIPAETAGRTARDTDFEGPRNRPLVRTTQELRTAWRDYACAEERMVPLRLFGRWETLVNPATVKAWRALEQALVATGYNVHRAWVYNCRNIAGQTTRSLHAYGLAIDIDHTAPGCNVNRATPDKRLVRFSAETTKEGRCRDVAEGRADTSFTPDQVAAVEAIRTVDDNQVFTWGGRWRTTKDTMHFQINVTPEELARGLRSVATSPPERVAQPRSMPRGPVDHSALDARIVRVMTLLVNDYGYPVNGAAGIVGNLIAESGLQPNRIEGSSPSAPMRAMNFAGQLTDFTPEQVQNRDFAAKRGPRRPGVGIAQWTSPNRRNGLFRHMFRGRQLGAAILFDLDAQVDYLDTELRGSYPSVYRALTMPGVTVDAASDDVLYRFEIPGAILQDRRRLPRTDPRVQQIFAERRALAKRALAVYRASQLA
ncbi:D-alanyl-D-alanine carboxypeptidase [Nocardia amikacinitolerans]|uniref:D-alanyl-D-alanine carboxypeptidase n=1 Tax=Nocardia amikacinitolerans TaxID=756689 RepID=A0A285KZF5_9NOCA|nr:phage tail tip lysozyme [Nocardia amikacinitolerans]SNY78034.1 D-alanyl-D-alanine carboxypeptidase [Nocardia amikacinitolerans]